MRRTIKTIGIHAFHMFKIWSTDMKDKIQIKILEMKNTIIRLKNWPDESNSRLDITKKKKKNKWT